MRLLLLGQHLLPTHAQMLCGCRYCDFPVIAVGKDAGSDQVQHHMDAYTQLVLREMEATQQLNEQPLQTISFGGGEMGSQRQRKAPAWLAVQHVEGHNLAAYATGCSRCLGGRGQAKLPRVHVQACTPVTPVVPRRHALASATAAAGAAAARVGRAVWHPAGGRDLDRGGPWHF